MKVEGIIADLVVFSFYNLSNFYAHSMTAMILGMPMFLFGVFTINLAWIFTGIALAGTGLVLLVYSEIIRKIVLTLHERMDEGEEDE